MNVLIYVFFFFSSRRRHTRSLCDWSSDVCSSDLLVLAQLDTIVSDNIGHSDKLHVLLLSNRLSNTLADYAEAVDSNPGRGLGHLDDSPRKRLSEPSHLDITGQRRCQSLTLFPIFFQS